MEPYKIKHILIPVDFSETSLLALEHGTFMAKLFKVNITLVHVIETYTIKIDFPEISFGNKQNISSLIEDKLEELAATVKHETGGNVDILVKTGKIAKKIVETAKEVNASLIIMGTHGTSGIEEFFVGSNAYRVVTESDCPVISVQTHVKKIGFSNILLPIDDSKHSREKARYVVEIAKHYNSKIHIAGILNTDDKETLRKFKIKIEQVEHYLKKHDILYTTEMLHGNNVADVALKEAKRIKADLIAVTTEQDYDVTGLFIGPSAQQVVNHSKIPVMSIKPLFNPEGYNVPMFTSST